MKDQPAIVSYLCDPAAIYHQSIARVRAETDLSRLPTDLQDVAICLVHTCGMPDIVADLVWSQNVVPTAQAALQAGAAILVDVEMVMYGICCHRKNNLVLCTLNDPIVAILAEELGTTRSAAAVTLWRDRLEGAVVAIGNAPTALFQLLQCLADGNGPRPSAILGFPVGFVGAAESKEALIRQAGNIPYLTLRGRRGGSALAAAAINVLLRPGGLANWV